MSALEPLRRWARALTAHVTTAWFLVRHAATPRALKAWWFCTLAYALSPIDLIPDFIPVLGFIDDVIVLPLMFWVGVRWTQVVAPTLLAEAKLSQNTDCVPAAQLASRIGRRGMWAVIACWGVIALALWFRFGALG